jgi:phage baseplate assembly protein W
MANGITYGINFPFRQSIKGQYLSLSEKTDEEIRSNLIHLLLTRKGSRYYLPDFGTRLYEFIFEPLDGETFGVLRGEIEEAINTFIPNLTVQSITIEPYVNSDKSLGDPIVPEQDIPTYAVPGANTEEYTAKIKIEYIDESNAFGSRQFVIINL